MRVAGVVAAALLALPAPARPAFAQGAPDGRPPADPVAAARAAAAAADTLADPEAGVETDTTLAAPAGPTAAPDTSLRVPGTRMRFGWTAQRVVGSGQLSYPAGTPRAEQSRKGRLRWFGIDGEANLTYRAGALERVRVVIAKSTPRERDYVVDQLRGSGYRRSCEKLETQASTCSWHGPAVIRVQLTGDRIEANLTAAPRPAAPPPAPLPPFVTLRDTFVLGREEVENALPPPVFAKPPAPQYPKAARSAGVQGRVWVRAGVDTAGVPDSTVIVRGIRELDQAALAAARAVRFQPYRHQDRPARYVVEYPITFVLRR